MVRALFGGRAASPPRRARRIRIPPASLLLVLALVVPLGAAAQEAIELPLSGPPLELATRAYKAVADGDFDTAVSLLREALRQRPDSEQLRVQLVDALIAADDLAAATAEARAADAADPRIAARLATIRERLAFRADRRSFDTLDYRDAIGGAPATVDPAFVEADAAYRALAAGRAATAVERARVAVRLAPGRRDYRMLLADALSAAGRPAEAEGVLTALIDERPAPDLLTQRGYLRLALGRPAAAADDFAAALRSVPPGSSEAWTLRLALADAAVAAGRFAEAEAVLTELIALRPDAALYTRRGDLRLRRGDPAAALADFEHALALGPARGEARRVLLAAADAAMAAARPEVALDLLAPLAGERSYAVTSRRGFALLALERKEEALAAFEAARSLAPGPAERSLATRTVIALLGELGRKEEARALLAASLADGSLAGTSDLDIAYLASGAGDDALALPYYEKAAAAGELSGRAYLDAAYVAKRRFRNAEAVEFFKAGIDAARSGEIEVDPQYLFGLRREVADITRTWGAYLTLTYGAVGVMPSSTTAPTPSGGRNVAQLGAEVYWRPPAIGYRNGALVEVFARAFETIYDERGGKTGPETLQGLVGVRWKPFSDWNLIFEGARLVKLGSASREDWLARAAFSAGEGTDLNVVDPHWTTWQVYGEADRFFETAQNVAVFEGRLGESFRLDPISDKLVATPFLALGGSYDSSFADPGALGAGPGFALRYWFREDVYAAPRSYVDLNLQYRFKLAGDNRARGVFAGMTVSY
jgi:tetratricopeptide (TPR) repeat protein